MQTQPPSQLLHAAQCYCFITQLRTLVEVLPVMFFPLGGGGEEHSISTTENKIILY